MFWESNVPLHSKAASSFDLQAAIDAGAEAAPCMCRRIIEMYSLGSSYLKQTQELEIRRPLLLDLSKQSRGNAAALMKARDKKKTLLLLPGKPPGEDLSTFKRSASVRRNSGRLFPQSDVFKTQ